MKYLFIFLSTIISLLLVTGCGTIQTAPVIHSAAYSQGKHDGCQTANGEYTKDSKQFSSDPDYENGWFDGRRECNPSFHKE